MVTWRLSSVLTSIPASRWSRSRRTGGRRRRHCGHTEGGQSPNGPTRPDGWQSVVSWTRVIGSPRRGVALRAGLEDRTDELASVSWDVLGEHRCARLVELVAPLTGGIVSCGGLASDNPIGLMPLE